MVYLDYSATTPVDIDVLDTFNEYFDKSIDIEEEKNKIQKLLNTDLEVIFTSCATESNNMAIKGIANKYKEKGYHIITTKFEHSSVSSPLKYLESLGFIIDYVSLNNGVVDLDNLKTLINDKTILVSICSVDSELGILQPIKEISKICKNHKIIFHSDMTQSIGKVDINLNNVDLISLSAHKFYGLKGIGVLLKRKDIELVPLMYGNKDYNLALIKSLPKALENIIPSISDNFNYVLNLNKKIRDNLNKYPNVFINSNDYSIPHILNISVLGVKPETFLHAMEEYDIYLSTKSACSSSYDISISVYNVTQDLNKAKYSLRISISYLTTLLEIDLFLKAFNNCYQNLINN